MSRQAVGQADRLAHKQVGSWAARHLGSGVDRCAEDGQAVRQEVRETLRRSQASRQKCGQEGRWAAGRGTGRQVSRQTGVQLGR